MAKFKNPLSRVKIASPCSADWESMMGDARRRFCSQCELNVYNLSEMTKREAEELLNQTEGRLCVRFYRRADGTVLTQDCPVGLRALRRRLKRVRNAIVSTVLSFLAGTGIYVVAYQKEEVATTGVLAVPLTPPPSQEKQEIVRESYAQGGIAPIYRQQVIKPMKRSAHKPS